MDFLLKKEEEKVMKQTEIKKPKKTKKKHE